MTTRTEAAPAGTLTAWAERTAPTLTDAEWRIRLDHAADSDMDAGFGEAKERALIAELDRLWAAAVGPVTDPNEWDFVAVNGLEAARTPLGRAVLQRAKEERR